MKHRWNSILDGYRIQALMTRLPLNRRIVGVRGINNKNLVIRNMNNLEIAKIYEGTYNIHTIILGHEITGIAGILTTAALEGGDAIVDTESQH
jgi:hypothetical protein